MFWDLAPCEFYREVEAARQRKHDEADRDLIHAWRVVEIYVKTKNRKKMPDLKAMLKRSHANKRQSPTAIRAALHVLSEQYGIPIRRRTKDAKEKT